MGLLLSYLAIINLLAFCVYGFDKYRAKKKLWRIPERTLLTLAWSGGALGAFVAMQAFRHKTKHLNFTVQVPLAMILWSVIIILL